MDEQTYWLIPRDLVDPARSNAELHRALLTYVVLFSGPALIADSATVRNRFLRRALRADVEGSGDGFMRDLIDRGYLRFAIREKDGVPISLGDTAQDLFKNAGPSRAGNDPFGETEFGYIEANASIVRYDVNDSTKRYQAETLRIFRDTVFDTREFPESYRRTLVGILEEYIANGVSFGLSDFNRDKKLWAELVRRSRNRAYLYDKYGDFVHAVARGPYVTYFPEKLDMGATYSPDDKVGLERWGGFDKQHEVASDRHLVPARTLRLADFVNGLAYLTAEDVHDLRGSSERVAYESALSRYAMSLSGSREVVDALAAYRVVVDERIMRRLNGLSTETRVLEGSVGQLGSHATEFVRYIVVELALGAMTEMNAWILPLVAAARVTWNRLMHINAQEREKVERAELRHTLEQQARALEAEKQDVIDDLTHAQSPTVQTSITVDKRGTIRSETSVKGHDTLAR